MGQLLGPHTHTSRAHETRAIHPGYLPKGQVARRGKASNPRDPSVWQEEPPRAHSRHGHTPEAQQGMPAKGQCQVPVRARPHPQ